MKYVYLTFLTACLPLLSFGQMDPVEDDGYPDEGWYFSGTGGGYFANPNTVHFYDGGGQYGINWIFGVQQYRDQIRQALGLDQQDFSLGELPTEMRYQFGFGIGLNGGVRFNERSSLFFDLNIVTLRVRDAFTIYVDDPPNQEPLIYPQTIFATEKRFQFNLGYRHLFGLSKKARPFLEVAASFNDTEVRNYDILIEESLRYSLIQPVNPNNPNSIQYQVGGSGYGAVFGGGVNTRMNEKFSFDFGAHVRFDKVVVDPNAENEMKPSVFIFSRIIFK